MAFDFAAIVAVSDLATHLEKVETEMRAVLATENSALQAPINRLLNVRGKRLRPSLVLAVAASQGKPIDEKVLSGAVAIELVHLGSLVHDDIIDEAETRWNIPTVHEKEGADMAIIVGDYLLAKACRVAAQISAEAAELIATTIGILCEGEAYELADQYALDRTQDSLCEAIRCKTASLLAAACQMGGICAGVDAARTAALGRYGEEFGMAFQLMDDVLDFISTPERLGKPIGVDVQRGVYTLPLLLALESPQSEAVKHWFSQPDRLHDELVGILIESGAFKQIGETIEQYNQASTKALDVFDVKNPITQGLKNLPAAYTQWAIQYIVAPTFQKDI